MTTHRELFDEAEAALSRAAAQAFREDTVSVGDDSETGRAHSRLVTALTRHLEFLHGHAVTGMANKKKPTEREAATSDLIAALRHTGGDEPVEPDTRTAPPAAHALAEAGAKVRLATDVLATHYRPGYGGRTTDAQLIEDDDARWAVTIRVADLASTAALTRSRLTSRLPAGRRAHYAGRVTGDSRLINAARRALTTAARDRPGSKAVTELGPFAEPLPSSNPLASAATALQYVRAEIHQLATEQRPGADSLRHLALLGLSMAQHTDAITRAAAARADALLPGDRAVAAAATLSPAADDARALARCWRELFGQLDPIRSPDPPQVGLAHAALAARKLLELQTRQENRWATPEEMHPTRTRMDELLTGIRAIALPLDELATAGEHAIAALQRRRHLYIDARTLPADPQLLHAQSTGAYVHLSEDAAQQLKNTWVAIANSSRDLSTSLAASTGLVGQHPRQAAVLARTSNSPDGGADTEAHHGQRHGEAPAPSPRTAKSAVATDAPVTGEATDIESARQILRAIANTADRVCETVENLSASFYAASLDTMTLRGIATILEAADHLKDSASQALTGMEQRHAGLEETVNASPHAATTCFYKR